MQINQPEGTTHKTKMCKLRMCELVRGVKEKRCKTVLGVLHFA
jgi:hypothetical protein